MSGFRRAAWAHPEWWALALSALAWTALFRAPANEHVHGQLLSAVIRWTIMVIAMMFPLLVGSIRITAERSLWPRRHRAIGVFLLGYLAIWLAAGAVIQLGNKVVTGALAFAIATAWQLGAPKRRALRSCHIAFPLAPRGWRADRDCVRYGWMIGWNCVASCGPLMAACHLTAHGVPAVLTITALTVIERYWAKLMPGTFVVPAGFAAFYALSAG